ncbi:hypothetical protein FA95DRAFT_241793 [Auriscalpium vulgare]|uniref:Uncharacterized protein n=1 Tax=Auriscalpium vulgare TaxID=40419 RepID=A0ACB8S568_9AGAM|nr:hypothetical protein FA95DRAFT_241793 [Auriscalpium vulgare]
MAAFDMSLRYLHAYGDSTFAFQLPRVRSFSSSRTLTAHAKANRSQHKGEHGESVNADVFAKAPASTTRGRGRPRKCPGILEALEDSPLVDSPPFTPPPSVQIKASQWTWMGSPRSLPLCETKGLRIPIRVIHYVVLHWRPPRRSGGPFKFRKEHAGEVDDPGGSPVVGTVRQAAGVWRAMSEAEKQPYREISAKGIQRYLKAMAKWRLEVPSAVLRRLNSYRASKGLKPLTRRRPSGRPKNPFFRYLGEVMRAHPSGAQPAQATWSSWVCKSAGGQWKAMRVEDKARDKANRATY